MFYNTNASFQRDNHGTLDLYTKNVFGGRENDSWVTYGNGIAFHAKCEKYLEQNNWRAN